MIICAVAWQESRQKSRPQNRPENRSENLRIMNPVNSPELQAALHAALERLKAGQLPQAEALYRDILRTDPAQAVALQFLGVIALQHSNYALAVQWLEKALQAKPDYAQAHNNLGSAPQALRRTAAAIAAFRR